MDQPKLDHRDQPNKPVGFLGKLMALAATAGVLVVSLMFSIVFFAIAVGAGILVGTVFWWKTRALRAQMREHGSGPPQQGRVIEGEVVRDSQETP
ncbi:MAG TPA: hypothetical protein VJU83_03370 [Burkholderiales bacterium]|nr:hypothetical protein [Burkholderiales bacterium]